MCFPESSMKQNSIYTLLIIVQAKLWIHMLTINSTNLIIQSLEGSQLIFLPTAHISDNRVLSYFLNEFN